ncbi:MAG: hypothetical protein QNJ53_31135 [Pleurocapsa sp. MO_192.B19]|nr:hypothetical protein [Pleurocapsa sp. MO_192.B19]
MKGSKLSPLEKAIARKIEKTKSKASQPGYLKTLIAKLNPKIEDALNRGCEYDDLAKSISQTEVKISAATLKQYHTEYCRQRERDRSSPLDKETPRVNEEFLLSKKNSSKLNKSQLDEESSLAFCVEETSTKVAPESNQPDKKQSAADILFSQK